MTRPAVTTAVEAVAQELRAAVLAGSPAPGDWLREQALAAEYQVARHTVRAALRVLAAERLLVIEPHRGARVATLDGPELQALFELRTALEVEAAHLLADRPPEGPGPAAWPVGVREAADELDRRCAAPDADGPGRTAVDAAHLALHHALVTAAGSPRITSMHATLATESRLVLLQSRPSLPAERMAQLHRELLDDLSRHGPDALRSHLGHGRELSGGDTPHP